MLISPYLHLVVFSRFCHRSKQNALNERNKIVKCPCVGKKNDSSSNSAKQMTKYANLKDARFSHNLESFGQFCIDIVNLKLVASRTLVWYLVSLLEIHNNIHMYVRQILCVYFNANKVQQASLKIKCNRISI